MQVPIAPSRSGVTKSQTVPQYLSVEDRKIRDWKANAANSSMYFKFENVERLITIQTKSNFSHYRWHEIFVHILKAQSILAHLATLNWSQRDRTITWIPGFTYNRLPLGRRQKNWI